MRKLFALALAILLAAMIVFAVLESDEGYVLIAVWGYTIEMPFVVAALLNLLAFIAMYIVFKAVRMLLRTRRNVAVWARDRQRRRGLNRTTQGLVAFVEGRWDFARKSLAKSAASSSTPLVNYLFAARASSAIGDAKAVDGFLKQAELSTEGADVAIGLTQAELQIQNKQYEQALATLLRVKKQANNHPVALGLLAKVYAELNDWQSLLKLIPSLRNTAMSEEKTGRMEQYACTEMLRLASKESGTTGLVECWKRLPAAARKRSVIVASYAEELLKHADFEQAENILRAQLQRYYDSQLIEIYGRALVEKPDKQFAYAQKLLASQASDPHLYIALGRIARHKNDFDLAIEYFEKSIALEAQPEAYAGLAKIHSLQKNYQASSDMYAKGVALRDQTNASLALVQ